MAVNKRKHPRVRARGVAANLRAQEVLKTGCVVENISAGGLLVRTDQPLEVGSPVVMDLVRPGMRKLLKLSGRVVGKAERSAGTPAQVPGLRVQFDPMPDETSERLVQLLRDLGLVPEAEVPSAPATPPLAPAAPSGPPAASPPSSPLAPAEMQQITWAQPEAMEETRAMSAAAVRTALEAADRTPPQGNVQPQQIREAAQAARAPPPIMPVPSSPSGTPPPPPRQEGGPDVPADPRLMVQIRGLLMELGEVQNQLDVKERQSENLETEMDKLRRENRELRERLAHAEELLRLQGIKDPGNRF